MKPSRPIDRRSFLKTVGAASLMAPLMMRNLFAASTSTTPVLRHASFGAAGMAWADIQAICSNDFVKLVAIAEVDLNRVAEAKAWFPEARIYQDWRELLKKEHQNLDSVNVSTPDHMHAPIAMAAMQLGKHVYCQKPLAHDLHETRMLTEYARKKGVVTQMGIQIHSDKVYRQAVALVHSGAIGKIKEVHLWSNKKMGRHRRAALGKRSRAGGLRLGPLGGDVSVTAFRRQSLLPSGQLAPTSRFWYGYIWRHGLPHF